jgi:tripartite-type tricarboxylate transporter receptor subunit TctC
VRALAVTSAERWPELPNVPTMHEGGFEGFLKALWFGLLAPAGTPTAVIGKLNAATNARLKIPETRAAIGRLGLNAPPLTPGSSARCSLTTSSCGGKSRKNPR